MNYLEKFNDTFKEFIDDLIIQYPDDPDFGIYKIGMYTALSSDDYFIINMFNYYVTSIYGDRILQRNEDFFLNHEMTNNCIDNNAMNIIHKIQIYWIEMSDDIKNIIWKYFRVLVHLDKKYRENLNN
jgi:hypothetical protein